MKKYDITVKNNVNNGRVDISILTNEELSKDRLSQLEQMKLADVQRLYKGHVVIRS